MRTHPIENYQGLGDSAPCLSRAATLPKATKLELGRGAHLKTPSSANHTAAASQPTGRIAKAASWLHLSRVSPALHQPSTGSSTFELPSAFAESGAYPPDRELPSSPRQCSLPLACRHPPEGHQIGARKRRTHENTILSQPYCRRVSTDRPNREGSQLAASLEPEPGPTPAGKTLPHSYPETRFRRERARDGVFHFELV